MLMVISFYIDVDNFRRKLCNIPLGIFLKIFYFNVKERQ